uniref:MYND-type domain-containing protein n=1 Tax=Tetradesmus obliquus TaxID=3088 RepID=A0A383VIH9_TETOB
MARFGPAPGQRYRSAEGQWRQVWQRCVLSAALCMWSIVTQPSSEPAAAAAAATGEGSTAGCASSDEASSSNSSSSSSSTATCTAGDSCGSSSSTAQPSSTSSDGSGSSSGQPVKRGHLLQLHLNPRWAAAEAAYRAVAQNLGQQLGEDGEAIFTIAHVEQQFAAALELCRALAAAAPVPVVCNKPCCENLAGVSEVAAANKRCVGCRCRYCSAACQAADWRRHKHACRRMAAAGEVCG